MNATLSLRFWALTIQQLYQERREPIPVYTIPKDVFLSFESIKTYHLQNQASFGTIHRLPEHMLVTLPSESLHLKHHLETSIICNPTQSTPISISPPRKWPSQYPLAERKRRLPKERLLPLNQKPKREPKSIVPLKRNLSKTFQLNLVILSPHLPTIPKYPSEFQNHVHTLTVSLHIIHPHFPNKVT